VSLNFVPRNLSSRPEHHALVFVMRSGEIPASSLKQLSQLATEEKSVKAYNELLRLFAEAFTLSPDR